MPCLSAIAKDACEYEGKMWEIISIVRFRGLPQRAECAGEKATDGAVVKYRLEKRRGGENMEAIARLARDIMNLLFPPVCAVCWVRLDARRQQGLCLSCSGSIGYLRQPLCRVCGMELAGSGCREYLCGGCLRTPPAFCLARSLVRYEPAVRQLVQRLKYAGDTSVVHGISAVIQGVDLSEFADCDWIIPVPLYVERHRSRGLNQATFLAGLFFPATHWPR